MQFNGVQLNTTGLDARTAYIDQGEQISENIKTVPNNPLYSNEVRNEGNKTYNTPAYHYNNLFSSKSIGLNATINTDVHKFITEA